MANHNSSSFHSRHLCERLFKALEKRLGPLKYEQGKKGCSMRGSGSVFAWVNSHAKNYGSIEIWFLGSADDAISFTGLTIYKRSPAAKPYGGKFNIRDEKQIEAAVKLLSTVSFPNS